MQKLQERLAIQRQAYHRRLCDLPKLQEARANQGGEQMTKQKTPETEKEFEKYENALEEYILDNWKKKGTVSDEKSSKEAISNFLYLLSCYAPICLVRTIIDVDDLKTEFNKRYEWKE